MPRVAYITLLLIIMMMRLSVKNAAVKAKDLEPPSPNHALRENGMVTSINTTENSAVNVTVAINWYFARKNSGIFFPRILISNHKYKKISSNLDKKAYQVHIRFRHKWEQYATAGRL